MSSSMGPFGEQFERCPYLSVTAMSAESAQEFFGGDFFKVICMGQDLRPGKRFGARVYRLFRTAADWNRYLRDWKHP